MKVAIVGSRTLDLEMVSIPLLDTLTKLPFGAEVLVRSGNLEMQAFEQLTFRLCAALSIPVAIRTPDLGTGRAGVFDRDIRMVEESDAVIAFFDPEHVMLGGTGHVVEKAIDKEKPTYAYEVDADGLRWVGGIEPPEDSILREWTDSPSPRKRSELRAGG
jgi:hypothetical protein